MFHLAICQMKLVIPRALRARHYEAPTGGAVT